MTNLLTTTFRIVIKPRETSKKLIEEMNINLSYWYFLIYILIGSSYYLIIGTSHLPQIFITDKNWLQAIYLLGYLTLSVIFAVLLGGFTLHFLSKLFKARSNFLKTILCIIWTKGPFLFFIILVNIFNYAVSKEILPPIKPSWHISYILLVAIVISIILITIIIQIIFLSELYQISILKTVILHMTTLIIIMFVYFVVSIGRLLVSY